MPLHTKLENLLLGLEKFKDQQGQLLKSQVIDSAYNIDTDLITVLISSEETKLKFFKEIAGHWVFNINEFVLFIQDKNFLDNSYTRFKNKIGLASNEELLKKQTETVLIWPFKDCVLEGGQTQEDKGRKEIFFNEVLAADEIDRLLDPKVFVNWTRHTPKGNQKVTNLKRDENGTIKENLLIKGNNLLALHSLKKEFAGKVKLIYIDPPYNTGNDGFRYNDNFNHSTWLTFMKNRLEVARELLRDDGVIFVQCDDNEQAYLKVLMDEVFGINHLVNTVCVKMSHLSGVKMSHNDKKLPKIKEYVHVYSKRNNIKINPVFVSTEWGNILNRYNSFLLISDIEPEDYSKWESISLNEAFARNNKKTKEEKAEFVINNSNLIFRTARNKSKQISELPVDNSFRKIVTSTNLEKFIYKGEEVLFASDKLENNQFVEPVGDIWSDIAINNLHNEGTVDFQLGKKPEKLIQRIINMVTDPGDIVLDYHLGSGTTAAVAHKMGRRYIGIEQMDYIETIAVERLKKVVGEVDNEKLEVRSENLNLFNKQLTSQQRQVLTAILAKIK